KMLAGQLALDTHDVRLLRLHDAGIYLLPREHVVTRLIEATNENRERAALGVRVTSWLGTQDFPAVEPLFDGPAEVDGAIVTCWPYLPQPAEQAGPPVLARALGSLLRELHGLPALPFHLTPLDPLARLRGALACDDGRAEPVLTEAERTFLAARMAGAGAAYAALDFPLGHGLIHNDAHIGNLLASPSSRY